MNGGPFDKLATLAQGPRPRASTQLSLAVAEGGP
jgi:hypothetical protein